MTLDFSRRRLAVCYYPEQWPRALWEDDARRMAEAGIALVRIGEFAWSRIEPRPGILDFVWLDEAVETLAAAGLAIVMGTPTATPPRWMLHRHPDMLAVGADGRTRGFGSRRHYDFSHEGYRREAARIAGIVAERYGNHPAVVAIQLDNEYGCHDTTRSYSAAARAGFRRFLRARYGTVEALNAAWGNVFWSMEYADFEEIDLPVATVTEANPAHTLAFRRFASEEVAAFNRAQVAAVRAAAPGRTILHNYMGAETAFDHFAVGADLDAAGWDSYPLGFLDDRVPAGEDHKRRFARQGDPDFQAFHHDLYRAVGRGRWWVMEQQPGPVNWAPHNPVPLPGMVRLWCWEAFAHGAEVVSLFRWRQAPFAQEQMHAGLLAPDGTPAPGLEEVAAVAREIAALPETAPARAPVALVFDYESAFAWEAAPHGAEFSYFDLVLDAYRALRRLGLSVDVLGPDLDGIGHYRLALVPGLFAIGERARETLAAHRGHVLIGPRAGAKTDEFAIPAALPPDLADLLDAKVVAVESLRPDMPVGAAAGAFRLWRERVRTGPRAAAGGEAADGWPVTVREGAFTYVCGWPDAALWDSLLRDAAVAADVAVTVLPDPVRVRDTAGHRIFTNYGSEPVEIGAILPGPLVLGEARLPPAGVAIAEL